MNAFKIALAAAAVASVGSIATASSFIPHVTPLDAYDTVLELDVVSQGAAGQVIIEDHRGNVVGMANVRAGANTDLKILLAGGITNTLTAKLVQNGAGEVATRAIYVDRF